MTVGKYDLEVIRKMMKGVMYSSLGQPIRIEWETTSGGTLKESFGIYEGGSKTENIFDTNAIITSIDYRALKQLSQEILVNNPAIIQIETDINLQNSSRFTIVQKLTTEGWGAKEGSGAADVWTPTAAPSWTVNQWKGFWLWFGDRRFKILSNTTTALTVILGDQTLPTDPTNAEILEVQEWYPVFNNQSLSEGMRYPFGDGQLLQGILCTKLPVPGDQRDE